MGGKKLQSLKSLWYEGLIENGRLCSFGCKIFVNAGSSIYFRLSSQQDPQKLYLFVVGEEVNAGT